MVSLARKAPFLCSSGGQFPDPLSWLLKPHAPEGWGWHCFIFLCVLALALSGETGHRWGWWADARRQLPPSPRPIMVPAGNQGQDQHWGLTWHFPTLAPRKYHSHASCQSSRVSPDCSDTSCKASSLWMSLLSRLRCILHCYYPSWCPVSWELRSTFDQSYQLVSTT